MSKEKKKEKKKEQVEFPEVNDVEMAFGGIKEQKKFEKLAQENGFNFMDGNKYSHYAMRIFYRGGKLPPKRDDVSVEYYRRGVRYFKCWIGSYAPKHERKEEVCGYILSLIADLEKEKSFVQIIKEKLSKDKKKKKVAAMILEKKHE